MTVNLTRIYTRLGDGGETHLGDMSRVPKTHERIEAYGTVDELNAQLGVALAQGALNERTARWLTRVQNDLFDVGADISVPEPGQRDRGANRAVSGVPSVDRASERRGDRERLRVVPEQTKWLEEACDEANADLPSLKSFVLPGGTLAAAQLHVCRTVCRRAERRVIACGERVNAECVRYLNRLSDLLFILSREANAGGAEPLWEPGRYR
jgi:cob(I)alamin adenosyltransferase